MRVTAIKAQTKRPERVSIYVNGSYAFSLGQSQLLDSKLYAGCEIDEARLAELKKASDFGKAYERVLNFLMIRPRSQREVQDYCRRKQIAPEDCAKITEKMTARGYLNDEAFAKAWVENRRLTKAVSQRRLRQELQQKGVAGDIITQVLAASEYRESDALRQLIIKKHRQPRYQDEQKLLQYLARQGFAFDDIKQALAQAAADDAFPEG